MNTERNTLTTRTRFRWRAAYLLASVGIYLVDQSSKAWAVKALRAGREHTGIRGFLDFISTENPGIAFSQLQEGGNLSRWFLVAIALAAGVAVFVYFVRPPRNDYSGLGACVLLLAGIAGNLTDRARLGYVIDFIVVHASSWHWPTFNVADASITLGALLLAYDVIFYKERSSKVETRLPATRVTD